MRVRDMLYRFRREPLPTLDEQIDQAWRDHDAMEREGAPAVEGILDEETDSR